MERDAPFKLAMRNEGDKGVFVYLQPDDHLVGAEKVCILSMHPRFAQTPGMERLFIDFVKEASKMFIEHALDAPGLVKRMEEREPPRENRHDF
jgi:hypothetical protein